MPRSKESLIRNFFFYNPENNKSVCIIDNCSREIKGSHASNLEKHVQRAHREIYLVYQENKEKTNSYKRRMNETLTDFPSKLKKIEKNSLKKKCDKSIDNVSSSSFQRPGLRVNLKKDDIVNACVKLVTLNGRPFSLINDEGFRDILDPLLRAFPSNHFVTIDDTSIKYQVQERASFIRSTIKNQLSGKLLSLKIDCTSFFGRSFVGLHVCTYMNAKPTLYTIGFIEIDDGNNVKNTIVRQLAKYDIQINQLNSIILDTDCNLIKPSYISRFNDIFCENDNIKLEESEDEVEIVTIYDEYIIKEKNPSTILLEKVYSSFILDKSDIDNSQIHITRCPMQVLQTAIYTTFKLKDDENNFMKKIRSAIKKMNNWNLYGCKKPVLDSPYRWISTYEMLKDFLKMKDMWINIGSGNSKHISMLKEEWAVVEDIIKCLTPCRKALLQTQMKLILPSDLYKIFSICTLEISKTGSKFSDNLIRNIEENQSKFQDVWYHSALLLDPRFNFVLSDMEKEGAIQNLNKLYQKIVNFNIRKDSGKIVSISDDFEDYKINSIPDELIDLKIDEEFEKILLGKMKHSDKISEDIPSEISCDIQVLLRNFCNYELYLHQKSSLIEFWESKKVLYPELYKLASTILFTCVTQYSFKQFFNQLDYFMNQPQSSDDMTESLLMDILLIRANYYEFSS